MTILKSFIPMSFVLLASCAGNTSQTEVPQARVDTRFTQRYMVNSGGVTGADGTMSILLDDGSSLFLTGDCFLGKVVGSQRSKDTKMINNSLIHIGKNGENLGSYYGGTPESPLSLCTPLEAATSRVAYWYWPGHGFQQGKTLHLFMQKFYQGGEGQWGFRFDGTDHVRINMEDYSVRSIEEVYDEKMPIHWGYCVVKVGDYYYIYGTRADNNSGGAGLYVARAKFDMTADRLTSYEYFDGKGWTADAAAASGCAGVDVAVSEQFSVFKHGDRYVLLTQRRAQQAGDIYSLVADNPEGPWRHKQQLYITTEQDRDRELFTYNAQAHPQFINDKDELLICYNVNSFNLQKTFLDVSTYRPVFLRVPMRMILE